MVCFPCTDKHIPKYIDLCPWIGVYSPYNLHTLKVFTDPGLDHGCLLGSPSWSRFWNATSEVTDWAVWRLDALLWQWSMHTHKHERKGRKYRTGMVEFQYCMPKRTFKSLSIIWFHLVNPYQTTHSPNKHTSNIDVCVLTACFCLTVSKENTTVTYKHGGLTNLTSILFSSLLWPKSILTSPCRAFLYLWLKEYKMQGI